MDGKMGCIEAGAIALTSVVGGIHNIQLDASTMVEDFKSGGLADWSVAEYDFNHPHFDTDWRKHNVSLSKNGLTLTLRPHKDGSNPFEGAAIRRLQKSHFGRYSATIRPAKGEGLVTGFFVYSGAAYGTRHDEIDIEFLGKDTTKLHIASFVDGNLTNHFIDLGFDAAHETREYGFDWYPDSVSWWIDGCEVFRMENEKNEVPEVPGYIFTNLWAVAPELDVWAGTPRAGTTAKAVFGKVTFTPLRAKASHD